MVLPRFNDMIGKSVKYNEYNIELFLRVRRLLR